MEPLFARMKLTMTKFTERQNQHSMCQEGTLATYEGNCFLGIDAGSTTTKAALVGEDGTLLYSFYSSNNGSPLGYRHPCHQGDHSPAAGHAQDRLFLLHRLRRGPD